MVDSILAIANGGKNPYISVEGNDHYFFVGCAMSTTEKKERERTPEEKEARRLKRKESSRGDLKDEKKKSRSSKTSKTKSKLPPIPPESELNTRFERLLVKNNFY